MPCEPCLRLLGPLLDGELTGPERQAAAEHLASCASCAAEAQDLRRLGRQLGVAGREVAPAGLAVRIGSRLAVAARHDDGATEIVPMPVPRPWLPLLPRRLVPQIAALVAVCLLSIAATWWAAATWHGATRLESEVVTAHIRSLLQDSQTQVTSSDSHRVKPWFAGRVDFAPDVKDLGTEGFALAGGRVDYLAERRVGALVYRRRLHVVTVFLWPAPSSESTAPRSSLQKGYNLVTWSRGGITYWAVSDLNAGELRQLPGLL